MVFIVRVEMKNVKFSFNKISESLLKNQENCCKAQGTLYVLKIGEVCVWRGGGGRECEAQHTRWCEFLGVGVFDTPNDLSF